jgi:acyl transferase domain-containing protein/NADPH:quinone reductase-like Zn-dependent oxidoreductase
MRKKAMNRPQKQSFPAEPDAAAIAIVGMGCRYPGGIRSPRDLWRIVRDRTDAIGDFPVDRGWGSEPGVESAGDAEAASHPRRGGFLKEIDLFDSARFGISPREASAMDPQQRICLDLAWETFERAGIRRDSLRGSQTGVFVGAMAQEYGPRLEDSWSSGSGHRLTGTSTSMISGRIAYFFGLHGPALTVDTACSSSLVAIHLAATSIRNGECKLALAGGVTVMSRPGIFVDFGKQQGLAPDGRCKSFSDEADGTGWSEGAGFVVLEPLGSALAHDRQVLAVLRGSAINSDGASNGLTAPNGRAQERVIRAALGAAGVGPADVDVVEAHGTGTTLGDPIEARALAAVYGAAHAVGAPLWIGSLKSNIGHSQAAAGVGGLIKMVEALRARRLPATLHAQVPSRHLDWPKSGLALLRQERDWATANRPRRAAVSSFGISGTNAHAILEEPPRRLADDVTRAEPAGPFAWVISAPSADELRRRMHDVSLAVSGEPRSRPDDVAAELLRRTMFEHRAVIVGDTADEMLAGLREAESGELAPAQVSQYAGHAVLSSQTPVPADGPVFVFPGQGTQWAGMGRILLETVPPFRAAAEECERALAAYCDWSLLDSMHGRIPQPVEVLQPTLWAMMVSLGKTWESLGVRPAAVVGHSQGEIAAMYFAGALTLDEAARVVSVRSRALKRLAGTGAMISLPMSEERAAELLLDLASPFEMAVVNGPSSTVVAGPAGAARSVMAECESQGIDARLIDVDYASHTSAIDSVREEIAVQLAEVNCRPAKIPFFSTVTGGELGTAAINADYLVRNLRQTVRFNQAMRSLLDEGHTVFIEVSSHPVLTTAMQTVLEEHAVTGHVIGTLRRASGDRRQLCVAAANLASAGVALEPTRLWPSARRVTLPVSFPRGTRHWLAPGPGQRGDGRTMSSGPVQTMTLPGGGSVGATRLSLAAQPWLADHRVQGRVIVPATVYLTLVAATDGGPAQCRIPEITFLAPLELAEGKEADIRVVVDAPGQSGDRAFTVCSRSAAGETWTTHATGGLERPGQARIHEGPRHLRVAGDPVDVRSAYARLAGLGYGYGSAFQAMSGLVSSESAQYAELHLPDDVPIFAPGFAHPALLDAALHSFVLGSRELVVPFAMSDVVVSPTTVTSLTARTEAAGGKGQVEARDGDGAVVLRIGSLAMARFGAADASETLLRRVWEPAPRPTGPEDVSWVRSRGGTAEIDYVSADIARNLTGDWADARFIVVELTADGDVGEAAVQITTSAARLIQRWLEQPAAAAKTLILLTRHAISAATPGTGLVADELPGIALGGIAGLVRSVQAETTMAARLIDMDADPRSEEALPAALRVAEPEIAVRAGKLYVPRLEPAPGAELRPPATGPWRLDTPGSGDLGDACLVQAPEAERPLDAHEVRIEVRASGLNFRDVAVGMRLIPTETSMGSEGAGVVAEVGARARAFRPGDRVFGVFKHSLGPLAVADSRMVRHIPHGWTFAQAASVPVTFTTAYQCLADYGMIAPGSRVLIHAATGGVGLAALQLARHFGAEVFATAGATWKHRRLADWGVDERHRASSRDTGFAELFGHSVSGGFDIVLNSLAGEFVDVSLRLVSEGGTFVEMGKTDIRTDDQVQQVRPGIRYIAYNLLREAPERVGDVLDELLRLFGEGVLEHPPLNVVDVRMGRHALEAMRRAAHVGKFVITMPSAWPARGPVLVTGGTGAIGSLTARHLVTEHGADHIVLLSRRGRTAREAGRLEAALTGLGARVDVVACDVLDREALARVVTEYRPSGVVHAAGVLSDSLFELMTPTHFREVMRPKAVGAWYLHELTRDLDLRFFWLYSSVAGILGEAGQANYAAANTFLDALAQHRRSQGLPAQSFAWGLWAEKSEMTASMTDRDYERFLRSGVGTLSIQGAFRLLDTAIQTAETVVVPLHLTLAELRAERRSSALFSHLAQNSERSFLAMRSDNGAVRDGAKPVAAIDPLALVRKHVAAVLGYEAAEEVPPAVSFKDMGLDSLLGVELRNRLNADIGLRLAADVTATNSTPVKLAAFIAQLSRNDSDDERER